MSWTQKQREVQVTIQLKEERERDEEQNRKKEKKKKTKVEEGSSYDGIIHKIKKFEGKGSLLCSLQLSYSFSVSFWWGKRILKSED